MNFFLPQSSLDRDLELKDDSERLRAFVSTMGFEPAYRLVKWRLGTVPKLPLSIVLKHFFIGINIFIHCGILDNALKPFRFELPTFSIQFE